MKLHYAALLGMAMGMALATAAPGVAHAREDDKKPYQLTDDEPLQAQLQRVESTLESERYSEISPAAKLEVRGLLLRMRTALGDRTQISQMDPTAQVALYNDQSKVNQILSQAHADSRVVCRRERVIGSNMPQNQCMTVAERRRVTENAQRELLSRDRNQKIGGP